MRSSKFSSCKTVGLPLGHCWILTGQNTTITSSCTDPHNFIFQQQWKSCLMVLENLEPFTFSKAIAILNNIDMISMTKYILCNWMIWQRHEMISIYKHEDMFNIWEDILSWDISSFQTSKPVSKAIRLLWNSTVIFTAMPLIHLSSKQYSDLNFNCTAPRFQKNVDKTSFVILKLSHSVHRCQLCIYAEDFHCIVLAM